MNEKISVIGPRLQQLVEVQARLSELADEGAVGLLSKTDVALIEWALGYASGGVEQGIPSPRAPKTDAGFNGPGKYNAECTELRERLKAAGLVLIVRGGMKGEGFEIQLSAADLVVFPHVLRDIANQIEAQLMGGKAT